MSQEHHRRQYERATVDIPVEFEIEGEAHPHFGTACDLGAGGMRLVTPVDVAARTVLMLRFRLRSNDPEIRARGHIVLSFFNRNEHHFQHGIAFTALAADDRRAIDEFVKSREVGHRA